MSRGLIRSLRDNRTSNKAGRARAGQIGAWMLAAALFLCGCQGGGAGNATGTPQSSQTYPFSFTLTTDKASYIRSEVVHATFTTMNVGTQIEYALDAVDATVSRNGQVVWQLSKEPGYDAGLDYGIAPLSPGQRLPETLDWDQRDQQGNYVAPGQYTMVEWQTNGAAVTEPFRPAGAAPPVTFTIQDMPVPAIPAAPTLTATKGNGADLLSWTAVTGAAGYHVYRAPGFDLASVVLSTASADQTSFSDTNDLLPGTKYYYTVRAFNIAGIEGPDSNQAIVQT